jgi:hypothetical protein
MFLKFMKEEKGEKEEKNLFMNNLKHKKEK